jgi:hypothetical protein
VNVQLVGRIGSLLLSRWQWVLVAALIGAALALLIVETAAVLGHLLNQPWLYDVPKNVTGPTASGAGLGAGAGAAVGGTPGSRGRQQAGNKSDGSAPVTDPHGPKGERPEDRAQREFDEQQRQKTAADIYRQHEEAAAARQRDLNPPPSARQQTLSDVYKKRY